MTSSPSSLHTCPKCHSSDRVRKVSEVVAEGTTIQIHRIPGAYTGIDGHEIQGIAERREAIYSPLASKLLLPLRPAYDTNLNGGSVFWLIVCLGWFALVTAAVVLAVVAALSNWSAGIQEWNSLTTSQQQGRIMWDIIYVVSALIALFFALRIIVIWLRDQRDFDECLAAWFEAQRRWEKLYYCSRDDVVFMPGELQSVPASQIGAYIKRH